MGEMETEILKLQNKVIIMEMQIEVIERIILKQLENPYQDKSKDKQPVNFSI